LDASSLAVLTDADANAIKVSPGFDNVDANVNADAIVACSSAAPSAQAAAIFNRCPTPPPNTAVPLPFPFMLIVVC
jgi:hypothetical protein